MKRPSVGLFFLGGTTLDEHDRPGQTIRRAADVDRWLEHINEMAIIADAEGVFITSGAKGISLADWRHLATGIKDAYTTYDGFVVVHQLESIPAAATAVSLILQKLDKPVVFVGSPFLTSEERRAGRISTWPSTREYGAKASIINAVQAAVSDVAEVVTVFGSHIFRGRTVKLIRDVDGRNGFTGQTLGKIDFGLRFLGNQEKRRSRTLQYHPDFDQRVAMVEFVPGMDLLSALATPAHGYVVATESAGAAAGALQVMAQRVSRDTPIVVLTPGGTDAELAPNIISKPGWSRNQAVVNLMWVLAQAPTLVKRKRLLASLEDQ